MGFITVDLIKRAYRNNECNSVIVYGGRGKGKTSFGIQALMELENTDDIDILKKYIFFDPAEFLIKIKQLKHRARAIMWDDAGVWLYYMDFQSGLLKSVSKLMQLIRTRTASVIYTTPTPTLILGKLRNFPETKTLRVSKIGGQKESSFPDHPYKNNMRRVTAYQSYMLPDLHKQRVRKLYVDDFNCILPNHIFKWYTNERKGYIEQLEEQVENDLPDYLKGLPEILKASQV